MTIKDARYYIGLEFCGQKERKHVLRFCGDFVKACDNIQQAEAEAVKHAEERGHNHTGWKLLASMDSVLWMRTGLTRHRIAYGADVKEFKGKDSDVEAAKQFGLCVRHQLECNGALS